ncbi:MAG: hypothetical protein ACD_11C00054G0003 [uncultured bacterium]|nr:MAG: hypothetical protein ACD_11C00054G0003 [uncultured bacterium]HBR71991.1 hypothetical protein [Candidatus Moranbacteria bacterium]
MKAKIKKLLLIFAIISPLVLFSGCGKQNTGYMVNLEIWGLFDSSIVYDEIINQYKKVNPYIGDIKFRKFTPETYKKDLLEALASGQGPDIFLVQNNWLPSFGTKLEPSPEMILNANDIEKNFADVVGRDFVADGKAYAVPLSVDSLALYYNKDMFNAAAITSPPKNWDEFNEAVRKLTKFDSNGNIIQSGAAFGSAYNINRSTDILNLLMLQKGVEMIDGVNMKSKLNVGVVGSDGTVSRAGENALGYYTQFANPSSPSYAWNNKMHYSIDAFAEGSVAMMLNYSWQINSIKNKNGKLNFGVAPIPQLTENDPANYANYWGYAVAKNKNSTVTIEGQVVQVPNQIRVHEAWQFLKFLTTKNNNSVHLINAISGVSKDFPISFDPAVVYLKATEKPAARRDIIELQKDDSVIGSFARGNLVAKSWFQADPDAIEKILAEMIDTVNRGGISLYDALTLATNRINDVMKR